MQIFEGKNKAKKHFPASCYVKPYLIDPMLKSSSKSLCLESRRSRVDSAASHSSPMPLLEAA